jgi:hypothetical protein
MMRISATVFILGLAVFLLFSVLDSPRQHQGFAPLWIALPGLFGAACALCGGVSWLVCAIRDIA